MKTLLELPSFMAFPHMKKVWEKGDVACYEIEPLEPGYGMTIAHALKRVLLSSLPGAAVTAIRIEGSFDGGQHIPGMVEEMADIMLNVKGVCLRSFSQHPVFLHLDVYGKREVTAADIITPDTIEILNPQLHLATLSQEDAHLVVELVIQMGRGYVPAEAIQAPEGFIPLDAIYTPLRSAQYTIEHIRVGKMVNFDKIVFEIHTNGALSPDKALSRSAKILQQQFLMLTTTPAPVFEHEKSNIASTVLIPHHIYDLPLDALHLPIRKANSFRRNGITHVGQILVMDEDDLRGIRNIGEKSIVEIVAALRTAGCFPSEDTP